MNKTTPREKGKGRKKEALGRRRRNHWEKEQRKQPTMRGKREQHLPR
jgi:hypothetical protein